MTDPLMICLISWVKAEMLQEIRIEQMTFFVFILTKLDGKGPAAKWKTAPQTTGIAIPAISCCGAPHIGIRLVIIISVLQYRSEKLPFIDFQENMFRQDLLTFTRVMIKYQYLCNIS